MILIILLHVWLGVSSISLSFARIYQLICSFYPRPLCSVRHTMLNLLIEWNDNNNRVCECMCICVLYGNMRNAMHCTLLSFHSYSFLHSVFFFFFMTRTQQRYTRIRARCSYYTYSYKCNDMHAHFGFGQSKYNAYEPYLWSGCAWMGLGTVIAQYCTSTSII